METRTIVKDDIADLKLIIVHEQERIAELQRSGHRSQSRSARDRLYELINRLDVLQAIQRVGSGENAD